MGLNHTTRVPSPRVCHASLELKSAFNFGAARKTDTVSPGERNVNVKQGILNCLGVCSQTAGWAHVNSLYITASPAANLGIDTIPNVHI